MSILLTIAGIAGFIALTSKGKKSTVESSNSLIKINSDCSKFISPIKLTQNGFGYDNRSLGLSGFFLQQYNWTNSKTNFIVSQFNNLSEKTGENLINLGEDFLEYFYGIPCKDFVPNSLKEYLYLDSLLTSIFVLYDQKLITDDNLSKLISLMELEFAKNKYIASTENLKLVSTKDELILNYYQKLFKLIPSFIKIPTKILSKNELLRSSIKYIKEENTYKFYNFSDAEIIRMNHIIGKAKYQGVI